MAELVITESLIRAAAASLQVEVVQVGELVGGSMPLYLDSEENKYMKAANNETEEKAQVTHITLIGAAADGWALAARKGRFVPGAPLVAGVTYGVSSTAGRIYPVSEIAAGGWVTHLFTARDATTADIAINIIDVQHG